MLFRKYWKEIISGCFVVSVAFAAAIITNPKVENDRLADSVTYESCEQTDTVEAPMSQVLEGEEVTAEVETLEIQKPSTEQAQWTVFLYLCGADLESRSKAASGNLEGLMSAPANPDVRYVIQTGGSTRWHTDWINPEYTQRFEIQGDQVRKVYEGELVNMSDYDSLEDFAKWGKDNYKSDKTMFCFWDHGGAIYGAECDEIFKGDIMSPADMQAAFTAADVHYDIIGFDCCLMADFDVIYGLSSFADYYVASEETIPGIGWDYNGYASFLSKNPECTPKSFARVICDTYNDNLTVNGNASGSTLSVIDLSKMEELRTAVNAFVEELIGCMDNTDDFSNLCVAALNTKHYYYNFEIDLYSLAKACEPYLDENVCENVCDAVMNAVVHRTAGGETRYNNGISFFWGLIGSARHLSFYEEVTTLDRYLAFLDACSFGYHADPKLYERTEKVPELDHDTYTVLYQVNTNNGSGDLEITGGLTAVNQITYGVYVKDEYGNSTQISELGNLNVAYSGDRFSPVFDGRVASIDGNPVVLNLVSETGEDILYNVPVYLNELAPNYPLNLRVIFHPENDSDSWKGNFGGMSEGTYEILGISEDYSPVNEIPSRDLYLLPEGTEITLAYRYTSATTGAGEYMEGETVIFDEDLTIETMELPDGDYDLQYHIKDIFNHTYIADGYTLNVSEGKAQKVVDRTAQTAQAEPSSLRINCVQDTVKSAETTEETADETADEKAQEKDVTVLMYISGADEYMLDSMLSVPDSEEVNLLLQTGGNEYEAGGAVLAHTTQRFEIHSGQLVEKERSEISNFGSADTLEDFIKWGTTNYPAKHYVLVMYGEGGGLSGLCTDSSYDNSTISVPELKFALSDSGIHFDDIVLHANLMGSYEVAAALADHADYLIASEELLPDTHYSYGTILTYAARHAKDFDGEKFGKYVVDSLANDCEADNEYALFYELALIDLSKISRITDAMNAYGLSLSGMITEPEELAESLMSMSEARSYNDGAKDLISLMDCSIVDSQFTNDVKNAVLDAVVTIRTSFDMSENSGLSVFFSTAGISSYSKVAPAADYLAFLDAICIGWHNGPEAYAAGGKVEGMNPFDYQLKLSQTQLSDTVVGACAEGNISSKDDSLLSVFAENEGHMECLGSMNLVSWNEEENMLVSGFDGRIVTIDGIGLNLSVDSVYEDVIVYKAPVLVNGAPMYLKVNYYPDEEDEFGTADFYLNGSYEIAGPKF